MVLNSFSFCLSVKLFISPSDLNGFPGGSDHKEPVCNVGDPCIPGSGRSPGEGNSSPLQYSWASLVAQRLKHLPPMRETRVRSLGREDPLEKEMVTHSSILAWKIPWTEKPGRSLVGYSPRGHKESDTTERLHLHLHQYSCLRNPMDREAWQATVHGVSKSRTRLSFTDLNDSLAM